MGLLDYTSASPTNPMAGGSMAAYRDYVVQSMTAGTQPMTYPQWLAAMQQRQTGARPTVQQTQQPTQPTQMANPMQR